MAEPAGTPVAPFNPPQAIQVPRNGPGCSKPAVVGCAGLVLIGLFALLVSLAPSFIRWSFHKMEESIAPRLPPDLTAAERDRLHRAFEAAGRAASNGQDDFESIRRFEQQILTLEGDQRQLSHLEVQELTDSLESMNRRSGAPAAPRPGAPGAAPPGSPAPLSPPARPGPPGSAAPAPGSPPQAPRPSHGQGTPGEQTVDLAAPATAAPCSPWPVPRHRAPAAA